MRLRSPRLLLSVVALLYSVAFNSHLQAEPLPADFRYFLQSHCLECHSGDPEFIEGDIDLDRIEVDWSLPDAAPFWTNVYDALETSEMPPRDAESRPTPNERADALEWLERSLTNHSKVGGTLPRRLNRIEYEHTIRDLMGLEDFTVPHSFPSDGTAKSFDNVASGLVLSPPLLAQYLEIATGIADEVLPPEVELGTAPSRRYEIHPSSLGSSAGSGAKQIEDRFRLSSSRDMGNSAAWTSVFEAPFSGAYRLTANALPFQTDRMPYPHQTEPFVLAVYARGNGKQQYDQFEKLRFLGEFEISADGGGPTTISTEVELYKGEVLGLRWTNGPIVSQPGGRNLRRDVVADWLSRDRGLYAAFLELNGGKRGDSQVAFYDDIEALRKSDSLDLTDPRLDTIPENLNGGLNDKLPHNWVKKYVYEEMHRNGPALDILGANVEGPFRLIEDLQTRLRKERSERLLGDRSIYPTEDAHARAFLQEFLSAAFRRPVSTTQLDAYVKSYKDHRTQFPNARLEEGLHQAVRRALVSPAFLFRGISPGKLDDWDLASRLSYFLTSAPPDAQLRELAASGELTTLKVLEEETRRLLGSPQRERFVSNFTGQWLSTRALADIMPDPRLFRSQEIFTRIFTSAHRNAMIDETEMLFDEILVENHPIETFIDPGFSFRSARLNDMYGATLESQQMQRVAFPKGTRQGGIIGLASVMMATANGVDTHPVHRGVWLLENVLGQPTPSPPPDIPAIAPDTSGTITMREQLLAHQADPSCARCHERIDPLGFVMENFDPVGRWREHYPIYDEPADGARELETEFYSNQGKASRYGPAIDPSAIMPDGTTLNDVTDLKRYLLEHDSLFAHCLTEKLLVYATGRELGFGDRRVVEEIVKNLDKNGRGFTDLIVAVTLSESFRTR